MKINNNMLNSDAVRINQNPRNQRGLSLIELMISMVVGLFLLAGVVTNFISTKDADRSRDAISEMDANAQVIFNVMRQAITHAGYRSIEVTHLENDKAFYTEGDPNVNNLACRNGSNRDSLPVSANWATSDTAASDTLAVISLADNPCNTGFANCEAANFNPDALVYYDCTGGGMTRDADTVACSTDPNLGIDPPQQAKIYSSFRLTRNVLDQQTDRTLSCVGNRSVASEVIAGNVEAVQYLYGVNHHDVNNLAADRIIFRDADAVRANNEWSLVKSVQVGLLMRSSHPFVLKSNSTKTNYTLLNERVNIDSSDLRRLFRVYTSTFNLEN